MSKRICGQFSERIPRGLSEKLYGGISEKVYRCFLEKHLKTNSGEISRGIADRKAGDIS